MPICVEFQNTGTTLEILIANRNTKYTTLTKLSRAKIMFFRVASDMRINLFAQNKDKTGMRATNDRN